MENFINEFKEFINKGSVMDMAVGVIVGGAFGKIVTSLVDNVIMPLVGVIMGGVDVSGLAVTIGGASIKYGLFLQNVIDFLIIALVIFIMVRSLNRMHSRVQERIHGKCEDAAEPEPVPEDVQLLREMRDILKAKSYF